MTLKKLPNFTPELKLAQQHKIITVRYKINEESISYSAAILETIDNNKYLLNFMATSVLLDKIRLRGILPIFCVLDENMVVNGQLSLASDKIGEVLLTMFGPVKQDFCSSEKICPQT